MTLRSKRFTNPRFREDGIASLVYGRSASDETTPIPIFVDESNSLIIIDHDTNQIHLGKFWNISHYFSAIADSASVEILIKTSSDEELHVGIYIASGGDAKFEMFESPTLAGNGTQITIVNHNRQKVADSPTVSTTTTAYHTPTHNSPQSYGTALVPNGIFIPGGAKSKASGTSGFNDDQWVFAKSTDYLIKMTNISGAAQNISIDTHYHGH